MQYLIQSAKGKYWDGRGFVADSGAAHHYETEAVAERDLRFLAEDNPLWPTSAVVELPEPTYHEMFESPLGRASDAQQWADSAAGWSRLYRDDAGPFEHQSSVTRAERCRVWDERAAMWAECARAYMGLTDLDQLYA